jgi:8-oxo-dGTP pyrophosphatase MutT (NUDIX family)
MKVSCKAALYTPDKQKVLVAEYAPEDYGLPGGHIEEGENPEEAITRELFEELGLKGIELTRRDFWMHHTVPKLILGFTGTLAESTPLEIDSHELSNARWIKITDIANKVPSIPSYDEFILTYQND